MKPDKIAFDNVKNQTPMGSYTVTRENIQAVPMNAILTLITAWLLITAASIFPLPGPLGMIFLVLILIGNFIGPVAGLSILVILFHTPSAALLIPGGAFTWAALALLPRTMISISQNNVLKHSLPIPVMAALLCSIYVICTFFWLDNPIYFARYAAFYWQSLLICIIASLLIRSRGEALTILKVWAISAAAAIIIKSIHIAMGPNTSLYEYISDATAAGEMDLEQRVNIYSAGGLVQRLIWPGDEPNYTSALLTVGLTISLALARYQSANQMRWLICAFAIFVQIVGTYSRSGMISSTILILYHVFRGGKAFMTLGVLSAISAILTYLLYPPFQDRVLSITKEAAGSGGERYELWELGLDEWARSPIFGNGLSSYIVNVGWATHNTYIQLLAELGIFGLLLWIFVPLSVLRQSLGSSSAVSNRLERGLLVDLGIGTVSTLIMISTITLHDMKFLWISVIFISLLAHYTDQGRRT